MNSSKTERLRLWYDAPAANWNAALPLGNGRIGAMIFSDPAQEVIALNEDTLWSGYPKTVEASGVYDAFCKARALAQKGSCAEAGACIETGVLGHYTQGYLPMGELKLHFPGAQESEVTQYARELDIETALSACSFKQGGVTQTREAFLSAPDNALVLRLAATGSAGGISFALSLACPLQNTVSVVKNRLVLEGLCPSYVAPVYIDDANPIVYETDDAKKGIRFMAVLLLEHEGGTLSHTENTLTLQRADSAVLKLCVRSSFNGCFKHPYLDGADYRALCEADIKAIAGVPYERLKERHLADYTPYFSRVKLTLGESSPLPTDKRLLEFAKNGGDPGLYTLVFQYARYLLIASSREGTRPANLQGIWNKELRAPWSSNYTLNINTQMNYWAAESGNLSELHEPLFALLRELCVTGEHTAQQYYHAHGYTAHHNTDLWAHSTPVGENQEGSAVFGFWPMSAGWLSRHVFEHYEYTLDKDFLRDTALPLISGAAEFYLDMLMPDENGYLIFCPSTSPENRFLQNGKSCSVSKTTTMTTSIIRETLQNALKCCNILGITPPYYDPTKEALQKLPPLQIGADGRILEWDKEYDESEVHHRHSSHLYALYPANEITLEHTALAQACRRSLEARGDDSTGWALAWRICLWARLGDGNHALKLLRRQLRLVLTEGTDYQNQGGTYPNLLDAHPPFQIDGNFGTCAGMMEFFLQNAEHQIHLLPALPDDLGDGDISGICAKGGITVSLTWAAHALKSVTLSATKQPDAPFTVLCGGKAAQVTLQKGESVTLTPESFR